MITPRQPASTSIRAETSPVNAPSRSQCRFCAAIPILVPRAASTAAASAVNGGATTMSQFVDAAPQAGESASKNARVSACVLYIFQLPAITRATLYVSLIVGERFDPGSFARQKFERCAAASRNVGNLVCHAGLMHGGNRVPAADDGSGPGVVCGSNGFRDFERALRETRAFRTRRSGRSKRSFWLSRFPAINFDRLRPDVEPHPVIGRDSRCP